MKTLLLTTVLVVFTLSLYSQKKEEGYDFSFKPTSNVPRYYVITERKIHFGTDKHIIYLKEVCICRAPTKTELVK